MTSREQQMREDNEGSFRFRCGRKAPEKYSREHQRDRVGTENPIHLVPPGEIRTGVPEVEGEEMTSAPTRPLSLFR
jgi:hypothetical protein